MAPIGPDFAARSSEQPMVSNCARPVELLAVQAMYVILVVHVLAAVAAFATGGGCQMRASPSLDRDIIEFTRSRAQS